MASGSAVQVKGWGFVVGFGKESVDGGLALELAAED
jgi:hypothetical protein